QHYTDARVGFGNSGQYRGSARARAGRSAARVNAATEADSVSGAPRTTGSAPTFDSLPGDEFDTIRSSAAGPLLAGLRRFPYPTSSLVISPNTLHTLEFD